MRIEIEHLSKKYENGTLGLRDVTMEIRDGIFGLLGPNGAGKTSLMRILATLLKPTGGSACIGGFDVRRHQPEIRRILGYLPQNAGFYPQLTVAEYLDYVGILHGMGRKERRRAAAVAIDRVNLNETAGRRVGHLSGGMRQRLGIAQAILAQPQLIIVDEPTAGLDPEERIRVRNLLTELSGDRVIILSTHIVADVAASAGDLALLRRGEVIFHGAPAVLVRQTEGKVWWVDVSDEQVRTLTREFPVTAMERTSMGIRARVLAQDPGAAFPGLVFRPAPATLEDAYIWAMDDGPTGPAFDGVEAPVMAGSLAR